MACELIIQSIWQRCGSTLLQRIANRRPHTLVWGETGRWPKNFSTLLQVALKFSKASARVRPHMLGDGLPPGKRFLLAQLANLTPDEAACREAVLVAMRSYFATAYNPPGFRHYGFKEVMLDRPEVQLCKEAFPEATTLLLVRDPVAVWRSLPDGWTHLDAAGFVRSWNTRYAGYLKEQDERSVLVHYEDVIGRDQAALGRLSELLQVGRKAIAAELAIRSVSTARERPPGDLDLIRAKVACARYREAS